MSTLSVISSMATRRILADLAAQWKRETGNTADVLSIGGVDAAKRIRAGEAFDVAVLSLDALQQLEVDGFLVPGSVTGFTRSPAAVAVPKGTGSVAPLDAAATKQLLSRARKVGVSTGPSGKAVRSLLQAWGYGAPALEIVEAPPGVPVARLVANGAADVGFQQLSELQGEEGIDIVGPVPDDVLAATVFAMGICKTARDANAAGALLIFLSLPATIATKQQHGMDGV